MVFEADDTIKVQQGLRNLERIEALRAAGVGEEVLLDLAPVIPMRGVLGCSSPMLANFCCNSWSKLLTNESVVFEPIFLCTLEIKEDRLLPSLDEELFLDEAPKPESIGQNK